MTLCLDQGRIKTGNIFTDWAETCDYEDDLLRVEYTLIEFSAELPFTILTIISVGCNDVTTRRYRAYDEAGLGWLGRIIIAEMLTELASAPDMKVLLEDQRPQMVRGIVRDPKRGAQYAINIRCQRLGEDNGRDQLIHVDNYVRQIRDYVKSLARKPTPEEADALAKILSSPW